MVFMFDLMLKYAYFVHSRFASQEVKNTYFIVLTSRPFCIAALVYYDLLLNIKDACVNWRRSKKKFREDQGFMLEQAINPDADPTALEPKKPMNCCEFVCSGLGKFPLALLRMHILGFLAWVGTIRMLSQDRSHKIFLVFGHMMELLMHTIPFMMI